MNRRPRSARPRGCRAAAGVGNGSAARAWLWSIDAAAKWYNGVAGSELQRLNALISGNLSNTIVKSRYRRVFDSLTSDQQTCNKMLSLLMSNYHCVGTFA